MQCVNDCLGERRHDQAAIWSARKGRDGAFDTSGSRNIVARRKICVDRAVSIDAERRLFDGLI
jgi:hypothetical protein